MQGVLVGKFCRRVLVDDSLQVGSRRQVSYVDLVSELRRRVLVGLFS